MTHKRKIAVWVVVAAVAVPLVVLVGMNAILGPQVEVVQVRRGPIVQTVVASGHVMATSRVAVASLVAGEVDAVRVDEGSRVKVGDPLITIDDKEAQANLDQAEASLRQARARLAQLPPVQTPVGRAHPDAAPRPPRTAARDLRGRPGRQRRAAPESPPGDGARRKHPPIEPSEDQNRRGV